MVVRTVRDKGNEEWDVVAEDVGDTFDDSVRLSTFVKCPRKRVLTAITLWISQNICSIKSARRCSGMISDALRGAIQPNVCASLAWTSAEPEHKHTSAQGSKVMLGDTNYFPTLPAAELGVLALRLHRGQVRSRHGK